MFDTMKDFFLFAYKATEKMEEKSKEIHEERNKRWQEFREKTMQTKQEMREKMSEREIELNEKMQTEFKDWMKAAGFVVKEDIETLHNDIHRIEVKLDELLQR